MLYTKFQGHRPFGSREDDFIDETGQALTILFLYYEGLDGVY